MSFKYARLFARYSRMAALRFWEYKLDHFIKTFSDITTIVAVMIFWGAVFGMTKSINGWTFAEMMLLQGFFNAFVTIYWLFFAGAQKLNRAILEGAMDKFLTRPVSPIIAHLMENVNFFVFDDAFRAIAFFAAAFASGAVVSTVNLAFAFIIVFIAAATFALVLLCIECTSFWLGRMDAAQQMIGFVWQVGLYPTTVFPKVFQLVFTFGLPLFFLQTYPTMFSTRAADWASYASTLGLVLAVFAIWLCIFLVMWKKGLKRYEAFGG